MKKLVTTITTTDLVEDEPMEDGTEVNYNEKLREIFSLVSDTSCEVMNACSDLETYSTLVLSTSGISGKDRERLSDALDDLISSLASLNESLDDAGSYAQSALEEFERLSAEVDVSTELLDMDEPATE